MKNKVNDIIGGNGGNVDSDFSFLRDVWFGTHEADYAEECLKNPAFKRFVEEVQKHATSRELYKVARTYMDKIDGGEAKDVDDATFYEQVITACLLNGDYIKELTKLPDGQQKLEVQFQKKLNYYPEKGKDFGGGMER